MATTPQCYQPNLNHKTHHFSDIFFTNACLPCHIHTLTYSQKMQLLALSFRTQLLRSQAIGQFAKLHSNHYRNYFYSEPSLCSSLKHCLATNLWSPASLKLDFESCETRLNLYLRNRLSHCTSAIALRWASTCVYCFETGLFSPLSTMRYQSLGLRLPGSSCSFQLVARLAAFFKYMTSWSCTSHRRSCLFPSSKSWRCQWYSSWHRWRQWQ